MCASPSARNARSTSGPRRSLHRLPATWPALLIFWCWRRTEGELSASVRDSMRDRVVAWGMAHEKTAVPDDLLQRSQRLEEGRGANPPRTRLPEPIWEAAVEMAQRHGLHCTTKTLRLDYMRLKKRLPAGTQPPRSDRKSTRLNS